VESAHRTDVALTREAWSPDPAFAIGVSDTMGAKDKTQRAGKGHHLRRDHCLRSGAGDHQHAGVVDDTKGAPAVIEARRLEQEVLGLKSREARVVLNEQPARVGQRQAGTLRSDGLTGEHHAVWRGVVLHLLARGLVVFPRPLWWITQLRIPDPPRQRAVGHVQSGVALQQFLHAHPIPARTPERLLEPGQCCSIAPPRSCCWLAVLLPPKGAPRITR